MGATNFRDVQLGLESTWGTAVTPTALLKYVTECRIMADVASKQVPELRATLMPTNRAIRTNTGGRAELSGIASYGQINYLLESMLGKITPTGVGPYVRAGAMPTATPSGANTRALTLVHGDSTDGVYKLAGGLVDELTLSLDLTDTDVELKYSATMLGTEVTTGTLAVLSDPTPVAVNKPIVASDFAVWIDAFTDSSAGTIGTTAISGTLYGFELKLSRKTLLSRYVGSRLPTVQTMGKQEADATLRLMVELNATSKAYFDAVIAATSPIMYLVRLKATSGTDILQLDYAGAVENAPQFPGDRNGVKALDFNLYGIYNSGLASMFKYSSTSDLTAL